MELLTELMREAPSSTSASDHQPQQQPIPTATSTATATATATAGGGFMDMEHLFGKVATPSDVGKLNRLVIPKQYARKYFPHLDSPTKSKGIVLNFEDPNGKSWRFRYSYWRSSQSYVMTKGWSRFVKENNLHAGDLISFGRRAVRASGKYGARLYIDCRRGHRLPQCRLPKARLGQHCNDDDGTREWAVAMEFELSKYRRSSAVAVSVSHKNQQYDLNVPLIIDSMNVVERGNIKQFRLFGVDVEFCIPRE